MELQVSPFASAVLVWKRNGQGDGVVK